MGVLVELHRGGKPKAFYNRVFKAFRRNVEQHISVRGNRRGYRVCITVFRGAQVKKSKLVGEACSCNNICNYVKRLICDLLSKMDREENAFITIGVKPVV